MKSIFRFIITQILILKARQYLRKYRPQIIGITGSIGKTSAKEAIFKILDKRFKVHRSKKGFNTEIGLSLAILQEEESGFTSIKAWFKILKRILFAPKKKFEKLILELGADKPGDIKKLIKIAPPHIAVVTKIAPVHLNDGQFKDIEEIAKEKSVIIKFLTTSGTAILNYDDPFISKMETKGAVLSYGTGPDVMLRAGNVTSTAKHISFEVFYQDQSAKFKVPILGKFQIYILLPAIAIAVKLGIRLSECAKALETFTLPPSRMSPIEGVNNSMIIDSSYNASPASVRKALELLEELKAGRKIAAMGTMNETGDATYDVHLDVGARIAKLADILIAVGPEANTLKQGAIQEGMDEKDIFTFFNSEDAGYFLKEKIQAKDIILVKGSQNRVRMERLVKVIMAHPEKASQMLCRQGEVWERI